MRDYIPNEEQANEDEKANRVFSLEQLKQQEEMSAKCAEAGCDDWGHNCNK
jgi:hypothetical protein